MRTLVLLALLALSLSSAVGKVSYGKASQKQGDLDEVDFDESTRDFDDVKDWDEADFDDQEADLDEVQDWDEADFDDSDETDALGFSEKDFDDIQDLDDMDFDDKDFDDQDFDDKDFDDKDFDEKDFDDTVDLDDQDFDDADDIKFTYDAPKASKAAPKKTTAVQNEDLQLYASEQTTNSWWNWVLSF